MTGSLRRLLSPTLWAAHILLLASALAFAAGGPENAVLVVNADNADSTALAEEYARLRVIPHSNVIQLSNVPGDPKITVDDFRDKILRPVLQAIEARGLRDQIDYVIYSCGFPYAVDVSGDMQGRKFPRVVTQPASITGLTYLHELVLAEGAKYLEMDSNWYFRPVKRQGPPADYSQSERAMKATLDGLLDQFQQARGKAEQEKTEPDPEAKRWLDEAVVILQTLVANHHSPELLYDLACVLALQGKPDEAMAALQAAFDAGWWNAGLTGADSDLKSLREREDFKTLLAQMRQIIVESEPALPFHNRTRWSRSGQPNASHEGRRYLLSAMLGYVGEAANTLDEALACIRSAAAADGTCPQGTVYYMESTDWARTGPRSWAFRSAVESLCRLGVKAETLPGVLPKDRADVAGAMIGAASFAWADSGSRILPGAFCDHLTSFGGVMTGTGQTVLSEFIRHGAAGACGTVTEPYNTPAKFPTPFLHVHYASGCTLAEAFYQSVHAPYQQLLVGDPLCRPWAQPPQVSVAGLRDGDLVTRSLWTRPSSSSDCVTRYELYVDGVRRDWCRPGGLLRLGTEGLAPGEHEARVVCLAGPLETTGRLIVGFSVGEAGDSAD